MAVSTPQRGELLVTALALPDCDRATLAQELIDSLPEDYDWASHLKPEHREAWTSEARQRVAEIDAGTATLMDGEEVLQRLREKFAL